MANTEKPIAEQADEAIQRTIGALDQVTPGATVVLYRAEIEGGPLDDHLGLGAVLVEDTPTKIHATTKAGTFKRTPTGFMQVRPWRHQPQRADRLAVNWASTERDAVVLKRATLWASIDHAQRMIEEKHRALAALDGYLADLSERAAERDLVPLG